MTFFAVVVSTFSALTVSQALAESEIKLYVNSMKDCTEVDQSAGRCNRNQSQYESCFTYENMTEKMMKCDLRGNARFIEKYTGNTKEVNDFRTEKLFPWQQQRVCMKFDKDIYNLWQLEKIGKPTFSCVEADSGKDPKDDCDVRQEYCKQPKVDTTTECDPYDMTCGA